MIKHIWNFALMAIIKILLIFIFAHVSCPSLHNKPHTAPNLALRVNTTLLAQAAKRYYNNSRVGVTYDMGARQTSENSLIIFFSLLCAFCLALALLLMVKEETAQGSIHWSNCYRKL